MAGLVRRWRGPLLGGIAIWLLSFPLLTSHPATATLAAAHGIRPANLAAVQNRVARQLALDEHLARAAMDAPTATVAAVPFVAAQAQNPTPQAAPAPPSAPVAPVVRANSIVIPRLGLNLSVGWYSDCLGRAVVPHWGAWRWSCAGANNTYIMAHNPGTFTPILGLHAGDIVQYGDASGRVHRYRVSYTTIVSNTQLWPLGATSSASLTLQTCWTWDGSRDFIVRAVEI
jgi:sortase (surface protein transpeptidase)